MNKKYIYTRPLCQAISIIETIPKLLSLSSPTLSSFIYKTGFQCHILRKQSPVIALRMMGHSHRSSLY
ncbi:hypothetical protein BABINDRAFT_109910 [Babjeviella inositovora NRRL Y-12698]|uniref:Uncharacterized protein n=1 Tax=Babjeviella inositovora NRRL Y-12698 TaxID=984486 RepID=A0A1E3QVH9_9ASCO|nr:uncharacterized protein BABINDRAFT_109910 [Babjeviella inositovora NRRL Y-12698]ODQ81666.1 hypothetical protein BABINDRAFT_109910 [Babjeviella inositovora NRRL Y-12698]